MTLDKKRESLQIRSLLKKDGALELSLARDVVPLPAAEEVVVRIDAAPINPSDLGLLLAVADWSHPTVTHNAEGPVVASSVPAGSVRAMAARVDQSMPVGNEGAGLVIEAGSSPAAQGLLGKTVAVLGGAMYSEFRCVPVNQCLALKPGTTAAEGASSFINPLTALGMIGTMQREGHKALVHTAAASNLGQMLNRVCLKDGIALINIVRTQEQEALLKSAGAQYVCRSDASSFMQDLTEALAATGATLAFDAIGGGTLAGQILTCMETALNRGATTYSRYGSATHKQVYLYGALDTAPTVLNRSYGMAWGVGGWLLWPHMQTIGAEALERMKERVATEIKTTFASRYMAEITLLEALDPKTIAAYGRRATGSKYLINPHKAGRSE
jgi:NADPH2:quinone reductase